MPTSFGGREREIPLAKLAFTSARKGSAIVSALRRMPLGAGAGAGSGPVSAIAVVLEILCQRTEMIVGKILIEI